MSDAPPQILILTTGGTIDKAYFDDLSKYQIGDTVIRHLLTMARVAYPFELVELMRKDSLELTDEDRVMLVESVRVAPQQRVIISHGTDTMTKSAEALRAVSGKTIVLVGALAPARFSESDASFNLGMAFAAVQTLPEGVYLTMNGTVFRAGETIKDRDLGQFVACARG
jgi:L-asparaginase